VAMLLKTVASALLLIESFARLPDADSGPGGLQDMHGRSPG
jgi:hypothetical protein